MIHSNIRCDPNEKAMQSGDDTESSVPSQTVGSLIRRFLFFAAAFSLAETALVASVSLAASLLGRAGSLSVSILYLTYAFGTLFAHQMVARAGNRLKPVLFCGQLGLVTFHLSCNYVVAFDLRREFQGRIGREETSGGSVEVGLMSSILLSVSASVSGICAGIAWAAAGAFITNTALTVSSFNSYQIDLVLNETHTEMFADSADERESRRSIEQPSVGVSHVGLCSRVGFSVKELFEACLRADFHSLAGNLSGLFNVIFLLSLLGGHIFTYYSLKVDDYDHVRSTYVVILLIALIGLFVMAAFVQDPLNPVQKESTDCSSQDEEQNEVVVVENKRISHGKSAMFALSLTFQTPELFGLVGTHISSGFLEGLVLCFVGGRLVSSPANIGILSSVKSITSTFATVAFSLLGNSPYFGRIRVLLVGAIAYLAAALATIIAHFVATSFETNNADEERADNIFLLLAVYFSAGVGFAAWQGTASGALLSEIAPRLCLLSGKEASTSNVSPNAGTTAAFSGCKFFSGVATAIAFFLFSNKSVPFVLIEAICVVSLTTGICQLLSGERRGVWKFLGSLDRQSDSQAGGADYGAVQVITHLDECDGIRNGGECGKDDRCDVEIGSVDLM